MLTLGVVDLAHIAKYKASACGHMLAHYRRDKASLERDNIDPERTHLNRTVQEGEDGKAHVVPIDEGVKPNWETVSSRIETVNEKAKAEGKRRVRNDAVVMADIVVTLPEDVRPGDEERFFAYTYIFIARKVGKENLMGGFVHRDEMRTKKDKDTGEVEQTGERVRDHMHVPFTPILDGRFNYKKMVPLSFYKTFHRELGDFLQERLGYRPEILLGEDKAAQKALSQVKHEDMEAAMQQLTEQARQQAAEIVRDAELRNAELNEAIADKQGDLIELDNAIEDKEFELRDARERLERLRQAGERATGRVEQLESVAGLVRRFSDAGRAERGRLLGQIVDRCRAAVAGFRDRLMELAGKAVRPLQRASEPSPAASRGMSLADMSRELRGSSAALERSRSNGRDWETER